MNDNEKAATFIGWKPCRSAYISAQTGQWVVCEHGQTSNHGALNTAPDMSRPDNYMKAAFDVVRNKSYELVFCIDRDGACVVITECGEIILSQNDNDWGGAVVKALAAIYDAEHLEGGSK